MDAMNTSASSLFELTLRTQLIEANFPDKRKPWDYKGRMEDMEQYIKTNMSRINNLEMVNQTLEGTVEARTQQGQQVSLEPRLCHNALSTFIHMEKIMSLFCLAAHL